MTSRKASITWANEIQPEPVTWAWTGNFESLYQDPEDPACMEVGSSESSGRIAAGTIAIAAGPEGVGKSSFGIALAAHVSTGRLPGSWCGTARNVLYAAVEDSWSHTLIPRLMASDADLSRIGRFEVTSSSDGIATLSLPFDNDLLEQAIVDNDVALVVLDPLLSLISEAIDTHRERNVRQALDPLAQIADRTEAVILGIAHFNKGSGSDISARITGSGAFKNVPRAIFGFGRDVESADGSCVLTQSKNSLGRSGLPSIRYRIESATIPTPKGDATTGRFVPLGLSDKTVEDILAASGNGATSTSTREMLSPAQEFILMFIEVYGDNRGEVPCRDLIAQGAIEGYTERELVRARSAMSHLVGSRKAGKDSGWNWSLVDHAMKDGLRAATAA